VSPRLIFSVTPFVCGFFDEVEACWRIDIFGIHAPGMWSTLAPAVPLSANVHPVFSFFCDDGVTLPTERRCDYGDIYRRKSVERLKRGRLLICSVRARNLPVREVPKISGRGSIDCLRATGARAGRCNDFDFQKTSRNLPAINSQFVNDFVSCHYVIAITLAQHSGVFAGESTVRYPLPRRLRASQGGYMYVELTVVPHVHCENKLH